jgi:16S rRNA (cytosine967-C5)-methyltransferase
MWWRELGAEGACALMARDNEPGELALRANTLLAGADALARELPLACHRDALIPEALVLEEPFDMHASALWREGRFIAQSRAAMLVARMLAPEPGQRVLDLCAAPGGKTTHIAALMQGTGEVVAVERNRARAGALARTAERMHASSVRVEIGDARLPRHEGAVYDRVLVDPPCSGLGTLQAHPDLRWRSVAAGVGEMAAVQARILSAGAGVLRPGGMLVYSTCTISPIENERLIASFLDSHPEFAVDDLSAEMPAYSHDRIGSEGEGGLAGTLLTLPHLDHTAGFFIARLRRR